MSKFFLHRQYDAKSRDVLLVFSSQMNFDEVAFDQIVQSEIDKNLAPDVILLLVRETALASVVEAGRGDKLISLLGRMALNALLCVVPFNAKGKLLAAVSLVDDRSVYDLPIDPLKLPALTGIFRSREAMVEAGSSYHFRNPSGRHTDRFMRIANIMVDPSEISFYAFCCLPHIEDGTRIIYVDTPAIFPLVYAINDHYRGLGVSKHVEVDSFGSYDGIKKYKFTQLSEALFIISASSSGSLSEELREAVAGLFQPKIINLVYLGNAHPKGITICNLKYNKNENPDGFTFRPQNNTDSECALCDNNSVVIRLRGDRFELTGPPPHPVMITLPDAPKGLRELMGRWVGTGAFAIGLAESGDKSRPYFIDFTKLLGHPEYVKELRKNVVSSFPQAATCIVSVDAPSNDLAYEILSLAGRSKDSTPVVMRDTLTREIDSSDGCHVVVVANVIESGRSLLEVSRDLRVAYPNAAQSYYIGFAKSESAEKVQTLKNTLTKTSGVQPHSFIAIQELVLPSSNLLSPWTRERSLLRGAERTVRLVANEVKAVSGRRKLLEEGSQLRGDEIFLPTAAGAQLALNPGFVFWPLDTTTNPAKSQADVFYTISSVLQSLRSKGSQQGTKSIRNEFFLHNVIDPAVFGRFNDGVIQACFLRAALPHELDYTEGADESREAARIIRRVLNGAKTASGTAALEFLLAIATGTLRLQAADLVRCLDEVASDDPLMSALIKLAKKARR